MLQGPGSIHTRDLPLGCKFGHHRRRVKWLVAMLGTPQPFLAYPLCPTPCNEPYKPCTSTRCSVLRTVDSRPQALQAITEALKPEPVNLQALLLNTLSPLEPWLLLDHIHRNGAC